MITENVYKIRIAVKSKGKGKSGGMRALTYLWQVAVEQSTEIEADLTIFLLSIYDKSDEENISDSDLAYLIAEVKGLMNE